MSNQVNSFPAVQLYFVHQKRFFRTQKHIFTTFYHFSVFFSKKLLTFSKHSDIMYQSFGYSVCIYPLISLLSRQDNNEIWVQRRWQRATLGWQRPWVQIPLLRPKSEVQSNLRFSFIFSQILAKSRVFMIISTGTFFPVYRIECACFWATTTCQTIPADFRIVFGCFSIYLRR